MSRVTHKLRILVAAVAVGSLMVLGFASTAQAGEANPPVLTGVCVANVGNCGDKASSRDSE